MPKHRIKIGGTSGTKIKPNHKKKQQRHKIRHERRAKRKAERKAKRAERKAERQKNLPKTKQADIDTILERVNTVTSILSNGSEFVNNISEIKVREDREKYRKALIEEIEKEEEKIKKEKIKLEKRLEDQKEKLKACKKDSEDENDDSDSDDMWEQDMWEEKIEDTKEDIQELDERLDNLRQYKLESCSTT